MENKMNLQARLGGGPSPSAAWEKTSNFTMYLSKGDIEELERIYQEAIASTRYKAGQLAYNASLAIAGSGASTSLVVGGFEVTVTGLASAVVGLFGDTYFSKIQNAANAASSYSANMSTGDKKLVTIDVYTRPANGEAMYILR